MEITGEIVAITTVQRNGKEKKELHLETKKGLVFVQFQGWRTELLQGYTEGQNVKVDFYFNGKISKLNVKYNNVIGTKIERV